MASQFDSRSTAQLRTTQHSDPDCEPPETIAMLQWPCLFWANRLLGNWNTKPFCWFRGGPISAHGKVLTWAISRRQRERTKLTITKITPIVVLTRGKWMKYVTYLLESFPSYNICITHIIDSLVCGRFPPEHFDLKI